MVRARREVEPACQIADLPPIDLVVLSHYHGDHFDDVAAQELDKKLPIVSTADAWTSSALGFERGHSLDTWESLEVHKGDATLKITAMPAKHATDDGHRCSCRSTGTCSTSAATAISSTGSTSPGTHARR
jgi:L-ascorbate metabolism protein UlaG (beta-lactamase superfamily)